MVQITSRQKTTGLGRFQLNSIGQTRKTQKG